MNRIFSRASNIALLVVTLGGMDASAHAARAQTLTDKLAIHGYLTQGYAIADSHQIAGIPHSGTFDYRRAALLFRFKGSPNDAFVVQLANRKLGESPTDAFTPDVQLDWAFYERRFGERTSLRIGKAPIPMGLFNETRYVGTLLPFYRAPFGFYEEGSFVSETLNGLVLTRQLIARSRWTLTGSLFGGGFDYLQSGTAANSDGTGAVYIVTRARAKNLIGAQFWLEPPVRGLRVGLGGDRRDDYGQFFGSTSSTHGTKDWWASAEEKLDRLTARAEYRQFIFNAGDMHVRSYYLQAGFRVLDELSVNVQRDVIDVDRAVPGGTLRIPYNRDNAVGVNYAFMPNIVAKFELHNSRGFTIEEPTDVIGGSPSRSNYLITSLSVSF